MTTFTYPDRVNAPSYSMLNPTIYQDSISPPKHHFQPSLTLSRNRLIWRRINAISKPLILLFLSIGYLTFCYIVNHRTVPLKHLGPFSITRDNLGTIKSAITTLNIAIVTLALYPVYDILLVIKSEEFFHALIQRRARGVPLSTINSVSSPVFGKIDALHAIIAGRCSRFFVVATLGSLIVFLTSILAPTALSIQSVLADGDIVALPVAAVANNSVYNTTFSITYTDENHAQINAPFAASILWAEMVLGVRYGFSAAASTEAGISAFIVPQPLNLPLTSTARWLTDVIALKPSCTWASTNITAPIIVSNSTNFPLELAGVYLEDMDLDVVIDSMDFSWSQTAVTIKAPVPPSVINHTTLNGPTDGSTVLIAGQCDSGCEVDPDYNTAWLDFTGIPTFTLQLPSSMTSAGYQSWNLAILVCKPNAVIETREVRAEGSARLSVQPLGEGKQLTGQGNLFPLDTTTMMSFALSSLDYVEPNNYSSLLGLGSQLERNFLFGPQQVNSWPLWPGTSATNGTKRVNASFLPVANLSAGFAQMLQSASKGYLSGYLGTAFVPARLSTFEVVFMSSLPLITVSTGAFFLLYILVGGLQLRKGGQEFNLPNIARIAHGSNLPEEVSRLVQDINDGADRQCSERDVIARMGHRAVVLQSRGYDSDVLQVN